jgi:magnesium chelatase family protein
VNSGFIFPARQIVINLSPNDTPKEGGLMEAAMAVAVLVASGQLPQEKFRDTAVLASLSLDGSLQTARGIAAAAVFAAAAQQVHHLVIPAPASCEITTPNGVAVFALRHLSDLTTYAYDQLAPREHRAYESEAEYPEIAFEQIFGLAAAKRALAIAAVGRHHMLMVGSPGTGKSLLARAYRYILPSLTFAEAAEVTRIHSLAGLGSGELVRVRPYRSPHHSTSMPALVGGSSHAKPGEISLAHHGTLFLDELPEFRNEALQSLREPLEDKKITIARARGHITYPADFQLIAAANPCRCGDLFARERRCSCKGGTSLAQFSKLVGPFLDRIALEINLNALNETFTPPEGYTTAGVQATVSIARARSLSRNNGVFNSELDPQTLYRIFAVLKPMQIYERSASAERLTMRSWLNTLRVALSIADLDDAEVQEIHVLEAMQYRFLRKRIEQIQAQAA